MPLAFGIVTCRVDRRLNDPTQKTVRVKCEGRAYRIPFLCDDEKEYLDWAAAYAPYRRLQDLTRETLQKVTRSERDVDKAAALFYHRVVTDSTNAAFLDELDQRERRIAKRMPDYSKEKILLAVAPGMFYRDNPDIGADGRVLRDLARKLGFMEAVIPLDQSGTVQKNGQIICSFIEAESSAERIILTSVSKAGGDVKMAIAMCGAKPYFKKVVGWYNVGGINRGSLLVNEIERGFWSRLEARFYFCLKGYDYDGLRSMRSGAGAPLESQVSIPKHVTVVNVVGIPLWRHVTGRAQPFYRALVPFGPNDGLSLVADSIVPGGVIYPAFRNDHYFRWPFPENRMLAFLSYLAEKGAQVAKPAETGSTVR